MNSWRGKGRKCFLPDRQTAEGRGGSALGVISILMRPFLLKGHLFYSIATLWAVQEIKTLILVLFKARTKVNMGGASGQGCMNVDQTHLYCESIRLCTLTFILGDLITSRQLHLKV